LCAVLINAPQLGTVSKKDAGGNPQNGSNPLDRGQLALFPSGERSPPAKFNVVVMYEDFGTRNRSAAKMKFAIEMVGHI
jgi:hypothetical protein